MKNIALIFLVILPLSSLAQSKTDKAEIDLCKKSSDLLTAIVELAEVGDTGALDRLKPINNRVKKAFNKFNNSIDKLGKVEKTDLYHATKEFSEQYSYIVDGISGPTNLMEQRKKVYEAGVELGSLRNTRCK